MIRVKFNYLLLLAITICAFFSYDANAQFFKNLGKKAEEAAKRATERAVEKKVEEKVEKAVENTIDEATDVENYKSNDVETADTKIEPAKEEIQKIESKPASGSSKTVSATAKGKRYPFEKGIIHQRTSAMGIEATPVTYFDKWGDWTCEESISEMSVFGMKVKIATRVITKGDDVWNIDLEKKTGTHSKKSVTINSLGVDVDEMTDEIMKNMKMEKLDDVEYLGYRCNRYKVTDKENSIDVTSLLHGNLTMQAEGSAMGIPTFLEVTKIDLSAPPSDKFEIPNDIKITEIGKK